MIPNNLTKDVIHAAPKSVGRTWRGWGDWGEAAVLEIKSMPLLWVQIQIVEVDNNTTFTIFLLPVSCGAAYCCQQHRCTAERRLELTVGVVGAIKLLFHLLVWMSATSNERSQVKGKHGDICIGVSNTDLPQADKQVLVSGNACLKSFLLLQELYERDKSFAQGLVLWVWIFLMVISQGFRFWRADFVWPFEHNEEKSYAT